MNETIKITGAKEHNLKNISLEIPKNRLVVFTGLSGSGKSTLAFDTLYAEGQRRYIESLSSYARQFLDRIGKPDVDHIEGLTPAIAIDQKSTSKNPRSTVGTITEIYDYLRLLYARIGVQHCHKCGKIVSKMSASDIIDQITKLPDGAKITILAPIVREKKGSFFDELEKLANKGYVRAMIDGVMVRLDEEIELSKTKKHTIKVVIDRVVISPENSSRIASDVEKALHESFGEVEIDISNAGELNLEKSFIHFSEHNACFDCKISFNTLEPLSFSFNSPKGACPSCDGLGIRFSLDLNKIIDENLSVEGGAIKVMYGFNKSYFYKFTLAFCEQNGINIKTPYGELNEDEKRLILYGNAKNIDFLWKRHKISKTFEGVLKIAYEILKDDKDFSDYMTEKQCEVCNAKRLKQESLAVKVAGKTIGDIIDMSIEDCTKFFRNSSNFAHLNDQQKMIATPILKEINERLFFLYDVGLGYLSLGRDARTISGGEAQRIRIASQIGSGLSGVMYVLDEPSIGLHERDTLKLIKTLRSLQEKGNTVIVVEHDKKTIEAADFIVDIGPGAGIHGGEVVFAGTYEELLKGGTQTAAYLNGKKSINYYKGRKQSDFLSISNVSLNNISNLNVKFPLRNLVGVTGVSGSGKSSLVLQTLLPTALEELNRAKKVQKIKGVKIEGLEHLDKVIYLDQSPIGRTPRSNPATYTGVMDEIRGLFASTKEAKLRGYKIGRFSFNVKGGRCEKCSGEGEIKVEMHFLPDINVVCDICKGSRYNAQTLEIEYKGKNIAEVLNMSVDEALTFFKAVPKIYAKLKTISDVGLGYVTLGQPATTLSGGEAQRIKLSKELSRSDTGNTLYVLDEPTTGLHFADVDRLVKVLHHLVDLGNSVIVIEHNLDVIKNCDYLIDMGPEGGAGGGKVVAKGTPIEVAKKYKKTGSFTGEFLENELKDMGLLK
ncbi:excinuclease ABC subunit UvrA [Campylobacter hyointestinalis]|uniref:UvrABC system protein A n=1 Tax=Campylobacter hyointestinalis subsp. hyointestinalis TaxID=91352 RepID=A0A855N638_CAMHY|nr:excinuclease ABC subunit UvrA [Campylobacter hyointestinalis]PPB57326.1 excinuclease ABC subunit A [Campylobacter hyointestinalis subsp. hyointestinalis]PPB62337.1 excinuclease ABC subunit A [Campylobacter hyointestinalis subsp. hyointestinalis]PPB71084.1 excinuclease ABC subunit A [Campylobacter hyointestinalis subsp. hyointestinalis]